MMEEDFPPARGQLFAVSDQAGPRGPNAGRENDRGRSYRTGQSAPPNFIDTGDIAVPLRLEYFFFGKRRDLEITDCPFPLFPLPLDKEKGKTFC